LHDDIALNHEVVCMKHSRFGLVFLLSCSGLLACNGDPTSDIRDSGASRVLADPTVVFLDKGETGSVVLEQVDAQGNQLPTTFTVTSETGLATVDRDTTFLETTNGGNLNTRERYNVTGVDYVESALSVTASNGDTLTIPVHVVPKTTIAATFSNATPALGEVVTVTAPTGISFSPNSTVGFGPNAPAGADVVVSPDGSSISFVPPPNLTAAPAQITNVVSVGSPDLTFTTPTATGITTPEVVNIPGTLSTLAPAGGQPVTVTLAGATTNPAGVTVLIGALAAPITGTTSTTVTFLAPPGAIGPVTLGGVLLDAAPQFSLTLVTPDTLTAGTTVPSQGGTGAVGTAPTISVPTTFFDSGTFDYAAPLFGTTFPARLYKFTIPADGDYDVTLDWASGEDLGVYYFEADGSTEAGTPADDNGAGGHPEGSTSTFAPGTYLMAIVNFSATDPAFFSIQFAPHEE
jgi:hypothetical protein